MAAALLAGYLFKACAGSGLKLPLVLQCKPKDGDEKASCCCCRKAKDVDEIPGNFEMMSRLSEGGETSDAGNFNPETLRTPERASRTSV